MLDCTFRSCGGVDCCKKNVDIQNVSGLETQSEKTLLFKFSAVLQLGKTFLAIIAF